MSETDGIKVPEPMWREFIARHGGKFFTVALRLADGRELEDIRVDASGVVVGTLFDDIELPPLRSSDIVGIRSVLSPWFICPATFPIQQ
jgi:hypothetical protein